MVHQVSEPDDPPTGADCGAFDYIVNLRMIIGFGLIAYPAEYGNSGIINPPLDGFHLQRR